MCVRACVCVGGAGGGGIDSVRGWRECERPQERPLKGWMGWGEKMLDYGSLVM